MNPLPAIEVRPSDPTPPYEQLRRQLAALIRDGVVTAGERLPPLRQLAGDLGLAVGTVARTYRELEAAGLVESRRGRGTRVADVPVPGEPSSLRHAAEEFVRRARATGAGHGAILTAVREALDGLP
ncbi:GntR family transcriptional regulator [Pseudosporangium ferrugineum]|uniref:DNA-binding transcriptional regulator YhcF (GntR family) n=1 Tax=Pseudosporangium ferrugineum TaxID=439699 RepID=A0A2T0SB31_9ACTN|nr:GntR family transcriptional regulator [Pseudosporangium ferrugineum]PRY30533.1 DNA-binding transcriptional regulator YhcF (GntR family) [Pseudosporangium ferrugineum]